MRRQGRSGDLRGRHHTGKSWRRQTHDTMVYELAIRGDVGIVFERAISRGRVAAREMVRRGGGHVLYMTSVPIGAASGARLEAARAALSSICRDLEVEWGSQGVRANAVVYVAGVDPATTIAFLSLNEAAELSGEALVVRGTGRPWRDG